MRKKFYITTPLYYVNDVLHLGHAYCTIGADCLARWRRKKGDNVFFLTGTDEHGQKVADAAREHGMTPREWADAIVEKDRALWSLLNISYDGFIRTTDERHVRSVQDIFSYLYKKGDIYKGQYEGWYCIPDETFLLDSQLKDGCCPECGRKVEWLIEESYFFRLSRYQERLLRFYKDRADFFQPPNRAKEMVNFVSQGLKDLSVSRTNVPWAIPVPFDSAHTIYVWFDALINYVSAIGYGTENSGFRGLWPADIHVVGKEIYKFHTVIWPAILMALDMELPLQVFGHGWWTVEGRKMSKSLGNVIDPASVIEKVGVDAFRYFILREVPFGCDGDFSYGAVFGRYNADLANNLGNLFQRTLSMIEKYCQGRIPGQNHDDRFGLKNTVLRAYGAIDGYYARTALSDVLHTIMEIVAYANKTIEDCAPWNMAKTKDTLLEPLLYDLAECNRHIAELIEPFMPSTAAAMRQRLGVESGEYMRWGGLTSGASVKAGVALFPRIVIT